MNNLDTITQREKILELIVLLKDENTPVFMKKVYDFQCESMLIKYMGKDYNKLFNLYLSIRKT